MAKTLTCLTVSILSMVGTLLLIHTMPEAAANANPVTFMSLFILLLGSWVFSTLGLCRSPK
jgi:hypothetical protein